MKTMTVKIFAIIFLFIIASCSKSDANESNDAISNYSISCKVDGVIWRSTNGNGAINNLNGNPNAFLLLGGSKEGGDQSEVGFNCMLQGVNVVAGNTTIIKGGFNGGEFIGLNIDGVAYVTNKGSANLTLGELKIITVGAKISGTFNAILYSEAGATITITDGVFNLPLRRF